jgi:hypothetical protein
VNGHNIRAGVGQHRWSEHAARDRSKWM